MKFIHLSDLHIGKRVHEASMLEDQAYILLKIVHIIEAERPDAVLIAGDLYDKSIPSTEAVQLCDDFLVRLAGLGVPVYIISGNHDSAERLAFCSRLIESSGITIAPVYRGEVQPIRLTDAWGAVNLYLLPFVKPAQVRPFFPDAEIGSYTDAVAAAVGQMQVDPAARNVLVAHQFVTGAAEGGSEELIVGGSENVDASVFDAFDYVALGHIHRPQQVGRPGIRYCGTPLKYSFSEAKHQKSVTVAELHEKGSLSIRTIPLTPKRDLVELRGRFAELTDPAYSNGSTWREDYVRVILTDEEDIPDAVGKLRVIYRNLLRLDYDNTRTRAAQRVEAAADAESRTPIELFGALYEMQNNQPITEEQSAFISSLIDEIWGEQA